MAGALYLVPTLLGPEGLSASLPPAVLETLRRLDGFVAENAKTARAFLKTVEYPVPLAQVAIAELNEHTPPAALPGLLAPVQAGQSIGLLSEAGCPSVADPGAALIALAHTERVRVVPLVGPSSLLLALMASGLNGQRFCFHGYLPVEREACARKLKELEAEPAIAHLFIEAPYRNGKLLDTLLHTCRDDTLVCLATDLMQPGEQVATRTVAQWRGIALDIQRRPTVFVLQAAARTNDAVSEARAPRQRR